MKMGVIPNLPADREALRRDGLVLFSKLIRTKNVDGLQETIPEQSEDRKQKLTVSI
ncbi:hypothetical protein GWI33_023173, partial [Rhynchophorus ferrugineus]